MSDLEKVARALAAADHVDPDQMIIPRWYNASFPLQECRVGWMVPNANQIFPAWQLYGLLAQAALDAMPAAPLLLTERADGR